MKVSARCVLRGSHLDLAVLALARGDCAQEQIRSTREAWFGLGDEWRMGETELVVPGEAANPSDGDIAMNNHDSLLWISRTHAEADDGIRALHHSGVDVAALSVIGKGYHSEEQPIGFYNAGDRIKAWGGMGAFWGGLWGLLLAPAAFVIPGLGVVAIAGPVLAGLFGALEGAVAGGSVAAIAGALASIGIPRDQASRYVAVLQAERYALMMHGSNAQVAAARRVLAQSRDRDALPSVEQRGQITHSAPVPAAL